MAYGGLSQGLYDCIEGRQEAPVCTHEALAV